jgi:RNA polymerase sigma factor (sigma-70 family)
MALRLLPRFTNSPSSAPPSSSPAPVELTPESTTREVAQAAATGDARATKMLLQRLAPRVARSVRLVMGAQHADFDDAVQLSLIALIQALPAFRGDCEPEHYASRIAVRTAMATRRRSSKRGARNDGSVEMDRLVDDGPVPASQAVSAQTREVLRGLLDTLPEEQAETLALRVVLGWSLGEVAEATSAPLNTVRSRLRLAKETLRAKLEANSDLLLALEVDT